MFLIIITILFVGAPLLFAYSHSATRVRRHLNRIAAESNKCENRGISTITTRIESVEQICQLLSSQSNLYEVIAIDNFFSREELLCSIIQHFSLIRVNFIASKEIPQNAIKGLYRSHKRLFARLIVIERNHSHTVSAAQIAASLSSFDFTLELPHHKILRPKAIESLVMEIASRESDQTDQIKSAIGERFILLRREWALAERDAAQNIAKANRILIPYKILKNERENSLNIFRFLKKLLSLRS